MTGHLFPSQFTGLVEAVSGWNLDGPDSEIGGFRRRHHILKWRATADEDGHYCFAVVL
jgi:hypothetical protein